MQPGAPSQSISVISPSSCSNITETIMYCLMTLDTCGSLAFDTVVVLKVPLEGFWRCSGGALDAGHF